jgi:8-oxo-dGTP diphosphatase
MDILKIIGVFLKDRKYLIARDKGESFFKNVGGRVLEAETDTDCLKRNILSELGIELADLDPKFLFEFPPTPAQGDSGKNVILKGYLIGDLNQEPNLSGDVEELAWVNTENQMNYALAPQIPSLILPKLKELNLVD